MMEMIMMVDDHGEEESVQIDSEHRTFRLD